MTDRGRRVRRPELSIYNQLDHGEHVLSASKDSIMRIALLQSAYVQPDKNGQLERLQAAADAASSSGAVLLVTSEMFLTGYNIGAAAVRRLAEPADGPAAQRIAAIARSAGLAIACGYPEAGLDGHIYNAAMLVGSDGERLLDYRKTHLFGEIDRAMFTPGGRASGVAMLGGVRIGLLICYDIEFPETVRALALAGADLVLVPTAQMEPHHIVQRKMIGVRAFENRLFIAYANCCGCEGELHYYGESAVCGPEGGDLARAGDGEEILFADLDVQRLAAFRNDPCYLRDRRPELYRSLTEGAGL
jgi:predicted amidohydrolase